MLITIGSLAGSAGATTVAALLARHWPTTDSRYLLEADPDGGVLAARWHERMGLSWTPGLVEVAGRTRGGGSLLDALAASAQPVGGGVEVIPALPGRGAVEAALRGLSDEGLALVAASDRVVMADVGRFRPPTIGVVRRSRMTLIVCRPDLESAQLARPQITELSNAGAEVSVIIVGDAPYPAAEFADAAGVPHVWSIPIDRRGAQLVREQGPAGRAVDRSRLSRAVRSVAEQLAEWAPPKPTVNPGPWAPPFGTRLSEVAGRG